MIDYWEALGRLVYDEALSRKFETIASPLAARLPHTLPSHAALHIEGEDYEAVQDFFQPVLSQPYLSLMAAGELIWTYRFEESRTAIKNLRNIVSQAKPTLYNPSAGYFLTLGLLITDNLLRDQVASKKSKDSPLQRLSPPQAEHLLSLARDKDFGIAATEFCAQPWDGGCNVRMLYWEGHLHPRGMDAPVPKEKEVAAASV